MHYPNHIAIIPDGNRTRAKLLGKFSYQGHQAGYHNAIELARYIFTDTPIQNLSLRGLSTENVIERGKQELEFIFELIKKVTNELSDLMRAQQVNFKWAGDSEGLPSHIVSYLNAKQAEFSFPTQKNMILCINYGGRNEIIRGIKKRASQDGDIATLSEEKLGTFLDFGYISPVDLVIRTKGSIAKRLSGFMLRWIGYAELFFAQQNFPDFGIIQLKEALSRFHERTSGRNFGK